MVCAAALCMVLACSGCRDKADDSTGTNVSVIEGDDVNEYMKYHAEYTKANRFKDIVCKIYI